jgi:hypothetical protein
MGLSFKIAAGLRQRVILGSESLGSAFYKMPENAIEITASKGSIPAVHV